MCGRAACTLCAEDFRKACSYKQVDSSVYELPDWREPADPSLVYKPSHNVAPTDVTPVLMSGSHFPGASYRVLQPMVWGMIPPWHKGNAKSHGLSTNNCRIEGVCSSKLYGPALRKNQRCIVLYDGFYEWKAGVTKAAPKQPYFIHAPQCDGVLIDDLNTWDHSWTNEDGWRGPRLIAFAGLFDTWTSPQGELVYSYTVITMDSDKTLSWLHHRMPAVLATDEQVAAWLDCSSMRGPKALSILGAPGRLAWYPVSTLVNNAHHKDAMCNKRQIISEQKDTKKSASSNLMKQWLKSASPKRHITPVATLAAEVEVKRLKKESSEEL